MMNIYYPFENWQTQGRIMNVCIITPEEAQRLIKEHDLLMRPGWAMMFDNRFVHYKKYLFWSDSGEWLTLSISER